MAAISAQQRAPVIVMSPASAQAARSQPGEPTRRADSAEVMKMPEPSIEPMTIMVASTGPSWRTRAGVGSAWSRFVMGIARPAPRAATRSRTLGGERLDLGDRPDDRLAAPLGQRAVERAGELVR